MAKNTLINGIWSDDLQLDLLNLVSDRDLYSLASISPKDRKVRTTKRLATSTRDKDNLLSFHYYGHLDSEKTFDKFIVSSSNQNAKIAAINFLKDQNLDFHLLYLNGSSGVGKSHLIHAIGNELLVQKNSFYLSSAFFAFSGESSLNILKNYSYILIDDLEDLDSSPDRQKILCELIDFALAKKIKIVITGTKSIDGIRSLEERLLQKLKAGLSFEIKPMDTILANKYIQKVISEIGSEEYAFGENVFRELLKKPFLNSYMIAGEISKNLIASKYNLEDTSGEEHDAQSSFIDYEKKLLEEIIDHLAAEYSIEREKILSNRREKEFSEARHMGMYLFKEKLGLSYNQIGKFFAKDHSTVIYAVDKIRRKIRTERGIRERNVLMRIQ